MNTDTEKINANMPHQNTPHFRTVELLVMLCVTPPPKRSKFAREARVDWSDIEAAREHLRETYCIDCAEISAEAERGVRAKNRALRAAAKAVVKTA